MQGDAVVSPQCAGVDAQPFLQARFQRQRKRGVDAAAEGRVDADPPVADLVAEPFHDQVAVIGNGAGGGCLVVEVREQVLDREVIEPGSVTQALGRGIAVHRSQLASHLAQRRAELDGPARGVGFPERDLAGLTRSGGDDDL